MATPACRICERQAVAFAFCFALDNAGMSMAARIAMMAITTSSSMRVKADVRADFMDPKDDATRNWFIRSTRERGGVLEGTT